MYRIALTLIIALFISAPIKIDENIEILYQFAQSETSCKKEDISKRIEIGDVEFVKCFISSGGDANKIDKSGWSILGKASFHGASEIVRLLIGADAKIDNGSEEPLALAVTGLSKSGNSASDKLKYYKTIDALIDNGSNINITHIGSHIFVSILYNTCDSKSKFMDNYKTHLNSIRSAEIILDDDDKDKLSKLYKLSELDFIDINCLNNFVEEEYRVLK